MYRKRITAVAAAFGATMAIGTMIGPAPTSASTGPHDGPNSSGNPPRTSADCSGGPWFHRKVIKSSAAIKSDYYNASPSVVTLSYGTEVGHYYEAENSYGHLWYKVGYSTRTHDYCGWMSANWVE